MKKLHILLSLLAFGLLLPLSIQAQELNCTVSVIAPTSQSSTAKATLKNLEGSIREFMSTKNWTEEKYQAGERIECQMLLNISTIDANANTYTGTIQVTSNRPVFGSTYNVGVLNVLDKSLSFKYTDFQQLNYIEGNYDDLTSILAFYAYTIIGMDYDTYIENGGTPYYNKAMAIVNSAQTSTITGWKSGEKNEKNRYMLVNELMDEQKGKIFRKCLYNYHRMGFDVMSEDVEKGREAISNSLASMEELYKANPFSYLLQAFFFCKKEELITVFGQASASEKTKVSALCQEMDPGNANKYAEKLRP